METLKSIGNFVLMFAPFGIGFAAFLIGGFKAMGPERPEKPIGFWRPWFALLVGAICAFVFGLGSCFLVLRMGVPFE